MPIEVRPARRNDVGALARTLARAFQDDPVFCWLQPDPARRATVLPGFFGALARHHFLAGGALAARGPHQPPPKRPGDRGQHRIFLEGVDPVPPGDPSGLHADRPAR